MLLRRALFALLPVTGALAACNADFGGRVCTTMFAMIPVVVVDAQGAPLTGMSITDSVLRTHERFTVPQYEQGWPPGTFQVFNDGFTSKIREGGDAVRGPGTIESSFPSRFQSWKP